MVALQDYQDTDLTSRPQAMAVAVLITGLSCLLVALYLRLTSLLAGRTL